MPLCKQAVEHPRAHVTGQMIVTDASLAEFGVLRASTPSQMTGPGGEAHQSLQNMRNLVIGKREVLVPPLLAGKQQPTLVKFGQM